jgi:hypothetical protein
MKKTIITLLVVLAVSVPALVASAGDQGPQRSTTTLATNVTEVTIPVSETGRFDPEWMLIKGIPSGSTQSITYVVSGITNTFAATSTDQLIALTNIPTMFFGDAFEVNPWVGSTNVLTTNDSMTVEVRGRVFD